MLKNFFTVVMLSAAAVFSANAQEDEGSAKPRMFVESFTYGSNVPRDLAEHIRQKVMTGLATSQRFDLVDETTETSMSMEEQRRLDEKAMADDKTRNQTLSAAGHDYIFSGNVLKYSINETSVEGKRYYTCTISYSVTVTDVLTSTTVASKAFEHSARTLLFSGYDTKDAAVNASANLAEGDMKDFLVSEFPLEGVFIPLDYEVKKDKLVTCYIELGSAVGVKVDDTFSVLVPTVRAGRTAYNEIGRIKVTEVVDGTLSFCKVVKEGKELYTALNAYLSLDERTREKQPIKVKSCLSGINIDKIF